MNSMNFLDLLNEPRQVLTTALHRGPSGLVLLAAAGLLGTVGLGLAVQAYFRGKSLRFSWGNLAANLGGLAWLLPVAAVFALYGFWMRPNLFNLPDTWSVRSRNANIVAPVAAVERRWSASPNASRDANVVVEARPALTAEVARRAALTAEVEASSAPIAEVARRAAPIGEVARRAAPTAEIVEYGTSLPDWVHENELTVDNARFVVVTGDIGSTIEEAVAVARGAAVELVRDDFAASVPQVAGWEPPASTLASAAIRRTFVEEIDRKTLSSGVPFRVYRAYDQVELSPRVRSRVFPFWKDEIVSRRIWALGGLAGLLTLTFATLATYFRLDARTSGLHRRRLKLATVCVIAAGGFAAATLL